MCWKTGRVRTTAHSFDIDCDPPKQELANKVLLPFLPDQFGLVLESQLIWVVYGSGFFCLGSQGTHFPLAAHSLIPLLRSVLARGEGATFF